MNLLRTRRTRLEAFLHPSIVASVGYGGTDDETFCIAVGFLLHFRLLHRLKSPIQPSSSREARFALSWPATLSIKLWRPYDALPHVLIDFARIFRGVESKEYELLSWGTTTIQLHENEPPNDARFKFRKVHVFRNSLLGRHQVKEYEEATITLIKPDGSLGRSYTVSALQPGLSIEEATEIVFKSIRSNTL